MERVGWLHNVVFRWKDWEGNEREKTLSEINVWLRLCFYQ